jgi:DNA modification methylase
MSEIREELTLGIAPYYADDRVAIYHADSRELLPVKPLEALLLSDPPYGMDYEHGARKGGRKMGMDGHSIVGDQEPFDPSHLLAYPRAILWGANHYSHHLPAMRGWVIWDKRDGTPSNDQSDCELAWTNILSVARVFSARWSGGHRTGREQREGRLHVNQKPVALMGWCIRLAGDDALILDPYMGSGSTLVAARELGRKAIGIDIEEAHCFTAAQRLSQGCLDFGEAA